MLAAQAQGGATLQAPTDIAQPLHHLVQRAFRLHRDETRVRHLGLAIRWDTIRSLETPICQLDKPIAREQAAIPQTLTSIPGIVSVFSAGIVAEVGPVTRFSSDEAWTKYAGTWRPPISPGPSTPMTGR